MEGESTWTAQERCAVCLTPDSTPASFRSICLCLCLMCSNPRRHLVVAVGDVILGDVVGSRLPHAIVAEDVPQRLVEMFCGIGPPDIVRMQRKAHDPAVFRPFSV